MNTLTPLVVILGPTAVGKTEISIRLAERLQGEIVSADSRLVYRGMDIGTDKPGLGERARVTHHLIDVTDPDAPWSLSTYQEAARMAIQEIAQRDRLPFLVGGTGLYVTAILEGWEPPPRPEDDSLREELFQFAEDKGAKALHARLRAVDPETAARIDYRNIRRVVRALEIYQFTGSPASHMRRKQPPGYHAISIGLHLPRSKLYARIDERIDAMLEAGLIDEVRSLLARGYSADLPAMSAIGYRQIVSHLQGEIGIEEAVRQIRRQTRQFVRRQANWFKLDDERIHWFEANERSERDIELLIREWLAGEPSLNSEK
jgi:tRNA dimethylallyltransferase